MGFILGSTTETQEELERVATVGSDAWKTAPVKPDDPPGPGDVPANIPQRLFNELREEEIREKKEAGPGLLRDDDRDTDKSERRKELEKAIGRAREAEARRNAADSRLAEVRSKLGNEAEVPATPSESNGQKTYVSGAEKYPDFADAMAEADRSQLTVPGRAATAIKSVRNRADVVYFLARNPAVCSELWSDPDSATQRVGEISAQLMRNPPQTQTQYRQPESMRPQELLQAHNQRMMAARQADPDAAAAVDRAGQLPINHAVSVAVLEQDNSDALVIHFARNPKVLEELNQLPAPTAMTRVGRIAEQLSSKAAAGRERVRAPEPISPVGGSSSRTGISLDELSPRDYIAVRNRDEFLKRRGGRR